MQYAPQIDRTPVLRRTEDFSVRGVGVWPTESYDSTKDRFDVMKWPIGRSLQVGKTIYPLRHDLVGYFYPSKLDREGEFLVEAFGSKLTGSGSTPRDAFLDWRDQIHRLFQSLYAKRPFEMKDDEKAWWLILENEIDVTVYRNNTPLVVKQIGKVSHGMRSHPVKIAWEDGTNESIKLEDMPAEFAGYRPGQPFEAIVERDPIDYRILNVIYVRRIHDLPWLSREEFDEFVGSIPTTKSAPATNWD